jgi:K+-transporting ATPase KdpF subunit
MIPSQRGMPDQEFVKIGQDGISCGVAARHAANDHIVIEDLLAALIGLALLIYLAYALARPERF